MHRFVPLISINFILFDYILHDMMMLLHRSELLTMLLLHIVNPKAALLPAPTARAMHAMVAQEHFSACPLHRSVQRRLNRMISKRLFIYNYRMHKNEISVEAALFPSMDAIRCKHMQQGDAP